jgi:hypothetical protein
MSVAALDLAQIVRHQRHVERPEVLFQMVEPSGA